MFLNKIMKKRWHRPPTTKEEVRKREEKYNHVRKAKDYKKNAQCLNRFNKKYRKSLNISTAYQYYSDVEKYMKPDKVYKGMTYLINNGYFTVDYIGRRRIIPTEEILEELFRREMCVFKDWLIWNNDKAREKYKKEKKKKNLLKAKKLKRIENRKLRKMLKNNK